MFHLSSLLQQQKTVKSSQEFTNNQSQINGFLGRLNVTRTLYVLCDCLCVRVTFIRMPTGGISGRNKSKERCALGRTCIQINEPLFSLMRDLRVARPFREHYMYDRCEKIRAFGIGRFLREEMQAGVAVKICFYLVKPILLSR